MAQNRRKKGNVLVELFGEKEKKKRKEKLNEHRTGALAAVADNFNAKPFSVIFLTFTLSTLSISLQSFATLVARFASTTTTTSTTTSIYIATVTTSIYITTATTYSITYNTASSSAAVTTTAICRGCNHSESHCWLYQQ
eukprot:20281-Heterococcus_DN1.PRE.2